MNGMPLGFGSDIARQRINELRRDASPRHVARGGKHDSGHRSRRPASMPSRPRPAPGR